MFLSRMCVDVTQHPLLVRTSEIQYSTAKIKSHEERTVQQYTVSTSPYSTSPPFLQSDCGQGCLSVQYRQEIITSTERGTVGTECLERICTKFVYSQKYNIKY